MINGGAPDSWHTRKRDLARDVLREVYNARLLQTWLRDRPQGWELVSGYWSPFYIQLRNLPSKPALFASAVNGLAELIRNEAPQAGRLIGIASAGVPIAAAAALVLRMPMGYTRKLPGVRSAADLEYVTGAKETYGAHALMEGDLQDGDRLVLIDDVVSRFTSKEVAIRQVEIEIRNRGFSDVKIDAVCVLIDREQGTSEAARDVGVSLHSLVKFQTEGIDWLEGVAQGRELEVIRDYLNNQEHYQDERVQAELRREAEYQMKIVDSHWDPS